MPAVARLGGRVRGRVRRDGAAGRLLARRVGDREADGHGVRQRVERLGLVPAARPVDGRRGPQLLLPRPPGDGDRDQGRGHDARRGLQPRVRAAGGAVGDRRVHVRGHAVGGRAAAAGRRPRRAGAGRRDRRRGLHRARQPRRRARVARRRRPARRLRLVRAVARDPGHDQRVPVVLVPARRPARPRARAAVHRRRARVRAPGRDRRPARGRGAARRRRGAGRRARGRRPVRDQLVVVPASTAGLLVRGGGDLAVRPAQRGRAQLRDQLAGRSCWPPASCSCCRSGSTSTRPPAGSRWSTSGGRSRASWATSRCCTGSSPGCSPPPSLRACWPRGGRCARSCGARWRSIFAGSLLASADLAGVVVLAAAARRRARRGADAGRWPLPSASCGCW